MAKTDGFENVNNVGATLFRGVVLAVLIGSVLFVLIPQVIGRMLPLVHAVTFRSTGS